MFDDNTQKQLNSLILGSKLDTPYYPINNRISIDELGEYDIPIETCFVIPKGDRSIIIYIDEIDQKGNITFNLFSYSENINKSDEHVSISEISVLHDEIVVVNHLMVLRFDDNSLGGKVLEKLSTPEGIHDICISS